MFRTKPSHSQCSDLTLTPLGTHRMSHLLPGTVAATEKTLEPSMWGDTGTCRVLNGQARIWAVQSAKLQSDFCLYHMNLNIIS